MTTYRTPLTVQEVLDTFRPLYERHREGDPVRLLLVVADPATDFGDRICIGERNELLAMCASIVAGCIYDEPPPERFRLMRRFMDKVLSDLQQEELPASDEDSLAVNGLSELTPHVAAIAAHIAGSPEDDRDRLAVTVISTLAEVMGFETQTMEERPS